MLIWTRTNFSPTKSLLLLISFLAVFLSCNKQKADIQAKKPAVNIEKLFPLSTITDEQVEPVVREAKRQSKQLNFIADLLKAKNIILWNSALKANSDEGALFIIPFVIEDQKEVNGVIFSKRSSSGDISFAVYRKDRLKEYGFEIRSFQLNGYKLQSLLNYFNAKLFNKNSYTIADKAQIPTGVLKKLPVNFKIENVRPRFKIQGTVAAEGSSETCVTYVEEVEWWYNPDGDECNCNGDEYYSHTEYITRYYCYHDSGGGGGSGFGGGGETGPGGGGGSGSGTNPYYDPVSFNGVQYTATSYPGKDDGFPWKWWEDYSFWDIPSGQSFGDWAINYLSINPTVPFRTFHNWFFRTAEYTGGEDFFDPDQITYDQPLQQVALPSLSNFEASFPKEGISGSYTQMPSPDVYELVGGSPYTNHLTGNANYQNACALRGSRGLLYAGISIPVLRYNGSQRTEKGSDNKNYILDARSFNKFMIDKFGDTPHKLTGEDANDPQKVADLLKDKNGIYVIINNDGSTSTGAGYSGHVDLILNGECVGGAYTTPTGGVKSIRIWVLN